MKTKDFVSYPLSLWFKV